MRRFALMLLGLAGLPLFAGAAPKPKPETKSETKPTASTPKPAAPVKSGEASAPKVTPRTGPPVSDRAVEGANDTSAEAQNAVELGMEAFKKGDLQNAQKHFQRLLQLAPSSPIGLVNLGSVEYRLKHWDEAERLLKAAVRVQPDAAAAWLTLGVLYYDLNRLDEALAALAQAIVLEPKNARAHNYLGVTVGKKGWYSGAEDELRRALELDPKYAEANFNLALFYLQRSPPATELARRHYQQALDLGAEPDPLVEKQFGKAKE